MKRSITINDNLKELLESTQRDTKTELVRYIEQNLDRVKINGKVLEIPCIDNDLDYDGSIHNIVDQAVPIYDQEIKDLWYLYSEEFEKAYKDAGVGDIGEGKWQQASIYFYLYDKLRSWYNSNAESITKKTVKKIQKELITKKLEKSGQSRTIEL